MPAMQGAPLTQQFDAANANQSIASFLIVRPPYGCEYPLQRHTAYCAPSTLPSALSPMNPTRSPLLHISLPSVIGWGWESDDRQWNDIFYLQAGEPLGLCAEAPAGVFSRAWSNGVAQLDCNSWTATLPFPSL